MSDALAPHNFTPETVDDLLDILATVAELYDAPVADGSPLQPLLALAADVDLVGPALLDALDRMPADSLALAHRLIAVSLGGGEGCTALCDADSDPATYLTRALESLDLLIGAFMKPEPEAIPGLWVVLTARELDTAGQVAALLAIAPDAAEWISHLYAGGRHPADGDRFYTARPYYVPDLTQIIDRHDNTLVHEGRPAEHVTVLARTMSAFPAVGARMSTHAARKAPRERGPDAGATPIQDKGWHELLMMLWLVSRTWRAQHGIAEGPWGRKAASETRP